MPHTPLYRKIHWPDERSELIGFRWYYRKSALPYASPNGQRFRGWVLRLKEGGWDIVHRAAVLLLDVTPDVLGRCDLVLSVPPSRATQGLPIYAMRDVAKDYIEQIRYGHFGGIQRVRTVPKTVEDAGMRDPVRQRESVALPNDCPVSADKILVLDDVTTTGATLRGAHSLVRERYRDANILLFAFGKTSGWAQADFPEHPGF